MHRGCAKQDPLFHEFLEAGAKMSVEIVCNKSQKAPASPSTSKRVLIVSGKKSPLIYEYTGPVASRILRTRDAKCTLTTEVLVHK